MSKEEAELLSYFRDMSPENQAHFLSLAHATRSAQMNATKTNNKKAARKTRISTAKKAQKKTEAKRTIRA
jgi:hypothetical protein